MALIWSSNATTAKISMSRIMTLMGVLLDICKHCSCGFGCYIVSC